jgi:hypothetical protein
VDCEVVGKAWVLINQGHSRSMSDPERRQLCLATIGYTNVDFPIYDPQDAST